VAKAKRERRAKLEDRPAEIAGLHDQEAFWALMAAGPDLVSHRDAAGELVHWFRRSAAEPPEGSAAEG
jgi:hypothetical protein